MVTPRCSNHSCIVRQRILFAAPLTLQGVVANIDSLLWQSQLNCPPTFIVAAPLTQQRVVANIDSLLWQPQLHCPPTYIVAAPLTLQRVVANIDSLLWQPGAWPSSCLAMQQFLLLSFSRLLYKHPVKVDAGLPSP
jgi:hypothetical protein